MVHHFLREPRCSCQPHICYCYADRPPQLGRPVEMGRCLCWARGDSISQHPPCSCSLGSCRCRYTVRALSGVTERGKQSCCEYTSSLSYLLQNRLCSLGRRLCHDSPSRTGTDRAGMAQFRGIPGYRSCIGDDAGAIAVNSATFVGHRFFGLLGGALATLSVIAPSIILVFLLLHFLARYRNHPLRSGYVQAFMSQ